MDLRVGERIEVEFETQLSDDPKDRGVVKEMGYFKRIDEGYLTYNLATRSSFQRKNYIQPLPLQIMSGLKRLVFKD